ncbi:MAG: phage tail protein [Leptospiraceae bacterium]|nr:phage tail protein [Leptospiraceae bacterium]
MNILELIASRLKTEFNRIQNQINSINVSASFPSGIIFSYGGTTPPIGFLFCDGSEVGRDSYSNLFSVIGTTFGVGNASTTFNLPDLRGRFIRYRDDGTGRDIDVLLRVGTNGGNIGDNVGSLQDDENRVHSHELNDPGHNHIYADNCVYSFAPNGYLNVYPNCGSIDVSRSTNMATTNISILESGSESRPKNIYLNGIISI